MKSKTYKEVCIVCGGSGYKDIIDVNIAPLPGTIITNINNQKVMVRNTVCTGIACDECGGTGQIIRTSPTICLQGDSSVN